MILIVDDDELIRMSLGLLLKRAGYSVETAASPEEAMACVRTRDYDLIIMDMNYSRATTGEEGIALLRKVRIFQPETPVILITAWGSIDLAVEGMRHGAFDFITKPWNNLLLLKRVETALSLNSREEPGNAAFNRCGIIGNNKAVTELLSTVERIAPTDAPVLILGENGTGKEMIANAIHANSRRNRENFVMVNLGESRSRCSRVRCSVIKRVLSQVLWPTEKDVLSLPTRALFSSTRSEISILPVR